MRLSEGKEKAERGECAAFGRSAHGVKEGVLDEKRKDLWPRMGLRTKLIQVQPDKRPIAVKMWAHLGLLMLLVACCILRCTAMQCIPQCREAALEYAGRAGWDPRAGEGGVGRIVCVKKKNKRKEAMLLLRSLYTPPTLTTPSLPLGRFSSPLTAAVPLTNPTERYVQIPSSASGGRRG